LLGRSAKSSRAELAGFDPSQAVMSSEATTGA
jgi:hypothetical protein